MPDAVVVGAGAFGSWIALRLRESGRSVVLVDAFGPGNPQSSSGGASRVIRMGYGPDEIYTRWSMHSLAAWKALFERAGRPGLFQHTGVLFTARRGHPYGESMLAIFRKLGVPHEQFSVDEIRRRYPALQFQHDVIGVFEPESGGLLANQAVQAVARQAVREGAELLETRIVPPREGGRLDYMERRDGRKIAAGSFVFACGPWLPKLFPRAVGARIRVTRQPIFYFDAPSFLMPIWIDFTDPRGGYALPPMDGKSFKLALDQHGAPFDPDTGSRETTAEEIDAARDFLEDRFPALASAPLLESEVCQYESTSSGDFLIDQHPDMPNVWLAGGGSGHGFKHGPAVGRYLVEQLDGASAEPRFSWRSKLETAARTVF